MVELLQVEPEAGRRIASRESAAALKKPHEKA
jgi:hypothetical protein